MKGLRLSKSYFFIIGLSFLWAFILLYPIIMGLTFCKINPNYIQCGAIEGFAWTWFGDHYWPTEKTVYFLDDLVHIHRYFGINKLGMIIVALFSVALGCLTYWLGARFYAWWRQKRARA